MTKSTYLDMEKVQHIAYTRFWTLAELARQARISNATIFALKSKRRKASMKTVLNIANALGVEPSDIVSKD